MDYDTASDFDINKAVAEALGILKDNVDIVGCGDSLELFDFDGSFFINYCNNPSDAWPIIESIWWHLIEGDYVGITDWEKEMRADDDSDKLRAAMIVYLKMMESK